MKTSEAIASLKTLCNTCTMFPKCVNNKPECFQAIKMAISALEKQEQIIEFIESRKQLHSSPAWYEFAIVKKLDEVKRYVEKMQAEEEA